MHYFLLPFIEQETIYKDPQVALNDPANPGSGPAQSYSWRSLRVVKTYTAPNDPSLAADLRTWDRSRGATSYSANWHAFGGGWDEDWQKGGKAVIPRSFPDGTSNTIAFFERYSECGYNPGQWNSRVAIQRIWGEDGQLPGPISQYYSPPNGCSSGSSGNQPWACPTYWIDAIPGASGSCGGWPGGGASRPYANIPLNYPINRNTGVSIYFALPQVSPGIDECDPTRLQAFSAAGVQVLLIDGSVRMISPSMDATTWVRAISPNDRLPMGSGW
jgi:hypothetical protein